MLSSINDCCFMYAFQMESLDEDGGTVLQSKQKGYVIRSMLKSWMICWCVYWGSSPQLVDGWDSLLFSHYQCLRVLIAKMERSPNYLPC